MKPALSLILFFAVQMVLFAQELQISGKVIDSQNHALPYAYLYNNRTTQHSHTNELGQFRLSRVLAGDTIRIIHLGFSDFALVVDTTHQEQPLVIRLQEESFELQQVLVTNEMQSLNVMTAVNLQTRPVHSAQEVLRQVPGLFIGQHAGGGKAEQIFLRGFDIDHGTDVSIGVDGMPVNMVSHAHGQGYADLHFLIPELIDKINFGKGPYYASEGNFTTAGYVNFQTKEQLEKSTIGAEIGAFNTIRSLAMVNLLDQEQHHAYIASEYLLSDGPFETSQHFNRLNVMGKYTGSIRSTDKLSVSFSHFQSKWDASGQIPQRLVQEGIISRFGAVDDTEGGQTSRTNLNIRHLQFLPNRSYLKSQAYFSQYDFELYSNFTFFLEDPINGDQIRQKESRSIAGIKSEFGRSIRLGAAELAMQLAGGVRYDQIRDNELSRTLNRRTTLEPIALGDIFESNFFSYWNAELSIGKWLINPALRLDYFKFDYIDALEVNYRTQSEMETIWSPKLNISYAPAANWQLYLKTGRGFHSNDTRVVVARNGREILPAAYGADLGTLWKPIPKLLLNTALWYLHLDQEFVYVGDAGVVEPSGQSRRLGVDFGMRYQLGNWLFFDADLNYAFARSINDPDGENYIPLAPPLTATAGLAFSLPKGWTGGLQSRLLPDRPASENNEIVAKGYFILDGNFNYRSERWMIGLQVENLLDRDWEETQFATASRLRNEPEPVEEIHFTPGTPRRWQIRWQYFF